MDIEKLIAEANQRIAERIDLLVARANDRLDFRLALSNYRAAGGRGTFMWNTICVDVTRPGILLSDLTKLPEVNGNTI